MLDASETVAGQCEFLCMICMYLQYSMCMFICVLCVYFFGKSCNA